MVFFWCDGVNVANSKVRFLLADAKIYLAFNSALVRNKPGNDDGECESEPRTCGLKVNGQTLKEFFFSFFWPRKVVVRCWFC